MSLEGVPARVDHLERVVDSLHEDSIRTQGALAALAGQLQGLDTNIRDIASKLDIARTRKPDLGMFAAWAMVLLTICGLAFYGVAWRLGYHEVYMQELSAQIHENETTMYNLGLEACSK